MTIQWFPGHMAKAKRQVQEKLKLVDFVMELVDARVPISSKNPMLQEILGQKDKLILFMKKDLADERMTGEWLEYYQKQEIPAIAVNVNDPADVQTVLKEARKLGERKLERLKKKGVRPRPIRAMILGIPNVGKSTLINQLVKKKIARTGDRPGVTTAQQWIKLKKDFELLDTPGILWPKFEDELVGYKLAAIGTIKDQLLPIDDVALFVLKYLKEHYPERLEERYDIDLDNPDYVSWFDVIGHKRGCLSGGGAVDYDQTSDVILRDLRTGKLGRVTLDRPDD